MGKKLSREEHKHRLKLYKKGLNDVEIAKRLGFNKSGIWAWRKKNDLSSNKGGGWEKLTEYQEKQIYQLYSQGLNDCEIARKLGIGGYRIWIRRKRGNLSSNREPGWKKLSKDENKHRMQLYEQGLNDVQIGKKVGATRVAIQSWRDKNNLPVNPTDRTIQLDFSPSWELGYLIGLTVGDGSLCKYKKWHTLRFASTRKDFIDLIENVLNKVWPQLCATRCSYWAYSKTPSGYEYYAENFAVGICSKNLYNFLKRYKKDNGIWLTPDDQPDIVKYGFIGGIIDAEGSITRPKVAITNKPKENLIRLKKLLEELGFIYGKLSIKPNGCCYNLNIYGKRNHRLLLENARLPYKRKKLEKYTFRESNYHTAEEYWMAMELRKKLGWYGKKLTNVLGISSRTVNHWIYDGIKPMSLSLAERYDKMGVMEADREKYLSQIELPIKLEK